MVQIHWMLYVLFATLIIAVLCVLLGTFAYAHAAGRKHQAAGWWAGFTLATLILADSSEAFTALPSTYGQVDLGVVVVETVRVSWLGAFFMAAVTVAALALVEQFTIPEKGIALVILLASCFSVYALAHLFLIRHLNGVLFTSFTGCCLGFLLFRAFFKTWAAPPSTVAAANAQR